jgi:toxin ParE1/3/4
MVSKFGYKLTQTANADLDDIVSYLTLELANPKAATDFVDKLLSAIVEACAFPESGPQVVNEFLHIASVRKKLVGKLYFILSA